MYINHITKLNKDGRIIVSADFLYGKNKKKTVYFSVHEEFEYFVNFDYSSFLAVALMPAMKIGEDIFIEGSVSEALFLNVEKIIGVLVSWNVGFNKIKIYPKEIIKDKIKGRHVGSFFSGGVDSFYTLLKNKHEPVEKISHLILVHGFDIDLDNDNLYRETSNNITEIAKIESKTVITVKTNLREFADQLVGWDFAHGGALAGVALFLRQALKRVYIPSTDAFDQLFPWGSHPDIDPLWSTESLEIAHDGNEANRVQKVIKYISKSATALQYLRVCYRNVKGEYNCGECIKCLRTMVELRVANILNDAKTFKQPLDLNIVRRIDARLEGDRIHLEATLRELEKNDADVELQDVLKECLDNTTRPSLMLKLRDAVNKWDGSRNNHRLYKFLSKNSLI